MSLSSTVRSLPIGLSLCLALSMSACGLPDTFNQLSKKADNQFGDQHFKTAITLIELHKVRYGDYPQSLADLKYTGEWDQLALQSVSYRQVKKGYRLTLERGWIGKAQLEYPPDFWQNLGIVETNVNGHPSTLPTSGEEK